VKDDRTLIASIENVEVTRDQITAHLADGRVVSVPLARYPRLLHATKSERADWRLIGEGEGIRWPALDEDVSVGNLLFGERSGESQDSLRRWLEARATAD
jgi:hypothetical protein